MAFPLLGFFSKMKDLPTSNFAKAQKWRLQLNKLYHFSVAFFSVAKKEMILEPIFYSGKKGIRLNQLMAHILKCLTAN